MSHLMKLPWHFETSRTNATKVKLNKLSDYAVDLLNV